MSITKLLLAVFLLVAVANAVTYPTPLQEFVAREDDPPVYGWTLIDSRVNKHSTTYILNMTSVRWMTPDIVSRTVWWHIMEITVPDTIKYPDEAGLYIFEKDNTDSYPNEYDPFCQTIAERVGIVMARITQVPNQPLEFYNGSVSTGLQVEDMLIAYNWKNFVHNTSDSDFLLRNPMVKASVKALDATQEFLEGIHHHVPSRFVVTGASKRGWTTWLMPAVDERVIAIIPSVIPVLNLVETIKSMWRSHGFWTYALYSYIYYETTEFLDTPEFQQLMDIEDPISYLPYLAEVPKYMVNAGNDEFFIPDCPKFYMQTLKEEGGETHLRIMPNAMHSHRPHYPHMIDEIVAFVDLVVSNTSRPTIEEELIYSNTTGSIIVKPSREPKEVWLWKIQSTTRDFRLTNCPDFPACMQKHLWIPEGLAPDCNGNYIAEVDAPAEGSIAFFIEVKYDTNTDSDFVVTSQANIVPDAYPFPDYRPGIDSPIMG